MFTLFAIFISITVLCVLYITPSLFNKKKIIVDRTRQENIEIAKQRLQEFSNQGTSDEEISEVEQELAILLAEDIDNATDSSSSNKPPYVINIVLLILIPVVSFLIYSYNGAPKFVDPNSIQQNAANSPQNIESLLEKLEQKLNEQPENEQGWVLAASIYQRLENYQKAESAYEKLNRLVPNNSDYLVAWADTTIMANKTFASNTAYQRLQKALSFDPNHINALWLAGLIRQAQGDNAQAQQYFLKLQPLVADDVAATERLQSLLKETAGESKRIAVRVSIAPEIQNDIPATAKVYIVANSQSESRIPLAVSRHTIDALPLSTYLTESMAMVADRSIADFDEATIYARVSLTGDPIQQSGDFVSERIAVDLQADNEDVYSLVIKVRVK